MHKLRAKKLDLQQVEVLVLRDFEDQSYNEIARLLKLGFRGF